MNTKKQNKANFKVAQASVLGVNQSPPPADSSLLPFPLSLLPFLQNEPNSTFLYPCILVFMYSCILPNEPNLLEAGRWQPIGH